MLSCILAGAHTHHVKCKNLISYSFYASATPLTPRTQIESENGRRAQSVKTNSHVNKRTLCTSAGFPKRIINQVERVDSKVAFATCRHAIVMANNIVCTYTHALISSIFCVEKGEASQRTGIQISGNYGIDDIAYWRKFTYLFCSNLFPLSERSANHA